MTSDYDMNQRGAGYSTYSGLLAPCFFNIEPKQKNLKHTKEGTLSFFVYFLIRMDNL
jgi:hypothetical protein